MNNLAQVGGVFAMLVFWHFVADWLFQSHKTALAKSKDVLVLATHCTVYTVLFWLPFWFIGFHGPHAGIATAILFVSHYVIDTYLPVALWAKHLRRAPQFNDVLLPVTLTKNQLDALVQGDHKITTRGWSDRVVDRITYASDEEAFKAFFSTPIGVVLCVTMDQVFHIAFLLPIAWLIVNS